MHGATIKLTGFRLVKKFHAFYGTPRFITAVRSASHLSLYWASFYYVSEMYLQLSQIAFSSSISVCVAE